MAQVFKRKWKWRGELRESKFWYLDYTIDGRRLQRVTDPATTSKKEAEEQLLRALVAEEPALANTPTVHELLDEYAGYLKAHSPSSFSAKKAWLNWWNQRFGARLVTELRLADVDAAIADLRDVEGLAPGTIGGYLAVLKASFRRALVDGRISTHPVTFLRIRFSSPERRVTWTDQEIADMQTHLPPWARDVVAVLRTTGLRVGDALALRWDQIDQATRVLRVRQQKTGTEVVVPLSEAALATLAAIRKGQDEARQRARARRLGYLSTGAIHPPEDLVEPRPQPYVFPSSTGHPRLQHLLEAAFRTARRRAGLHRRPGGAPTLHDLRRTFATRLLNTGATPTIIAAVLGQRSTRLVSRYAHAELETMRAAIEAGAPRPPETSTDVAPIPPLSKPSKKQGVVARLSRQPKTARAK